MSRWAWTGPGLTGGLCGGEDEGGCALRGDLMHTHIVTATRQEVGDGHRVLSVGQVCKCDQSSIFIHRTTLWQCNSNRPLRK